MRMSKPVKTDGPEAEVKEGGHGVLPGGQPVGGAEADQQQDTAKEAEHAAPFQVF